MKIIYIIPTIIATSLSSCIAPNSDPVGNGFKVAGDAIGNVVNGVAGTFTPAQQQQQPQVQPQSYPQTTPYQGQ